ncbi:MAG: CCXG family PEP-CTERM protein [Arenicella sp.]
MSLISKTMSVFLTLILSVIFLHDAFAYSTRVPVTISNTSSSALASHSIRLELNASNVPGFDWSNNGNDILVATETPSFAELDYYLESFDGVAQTAVLWVEVPSIPLSPPDTTIYLYYDNATATSSSSAADTFTSSGFKYHTQPYPATDPDPATRAEGEALFNFDEVTTNTNYGCAAFDSIERDNSGTYGSNGDIGYFYETFFEVPASATYEFRMGNDFGDGGELYVDGTTIEADWNDDLWWGFDYTNPDVLTGSIALTPGTHTLKALGFERCCDGPAALQYRTSPAAPWEDFVVGAPGLTLYAPDCPFETSVIGSPEAVPVTLSHFESNEAGPFIGFQWQTVSETFNVGFHVRAKVSNSDDEWVTLNKRLIRSRSKDSTKAERYQFNFNNTRRQLDIESIALVSVDVTGREEFHGTFELNQAYGEEQIPEPIDWAEVQAQYAERMRAKGYQYRNYRWRKPQNNVQYDVDDQRRIAMEIAEKGIYRVTFEDLLSQGVDWSGVPKKQIAISHQQQGIPRVIGGGRRFGKGSYIDFFANTPQGSDAIYENTSVYMLSLNPEFTRYAARIKRSPELLDDWHFESVHIEEQNNYNQLSQLDDPWQMHDLFAVGSDAEQAYTMVLEKTPYIEEDAQLEVRLTGVTDLPSQDTDGDGVFDDEHHVKVFINDEEAPIYDGRFDGANAYIIESVFSSEFLQAGENVIRVQLVSDTGYPVTIVAIDSLTLSYPVSSVTEKTQFIHTVSDSRITDGLRFKAKRKGLVAFAYQDDHNLARLAIKRVGRGEFAVPKIATGKANYWISHINGLLKPVSLFVLPEKKPLLEQPTDLLIISHPNFMGETLERYSGARSAEGVDNHIISTDDIANNYGVGLPLHRAIQRFLREEADQVGFESVLLVGGHSYDYLNHLSTSQTTDTVNFLPTFYHPVLVIQYSPTDLPFVDFDQDGRPEKSIGRWPVRTIEDLERIVDKSLKWSENSEARSLDGLDVVMLSDERDRLNFADNLDRVSRQLNASNLPVNSTQIIHMSELQGDQSLSQAQAAELTRQRMLEGVNNGADWFVYNGHASPISWSFQSLLNVDIAAQMGNEDTPMMMMPLACYTTYYESPTNDTVASQLLFGQDNGAVAIHGAMTYGEYYGNLKIAEEILKSADQNATIGEVIKRAKQQLPINYMSTSYNWALLGDPTLTIH